VAVDLAVPGSGSDHLACERSPPDRACRRTVGREADVLLAVGAKEMLAKVPLQIRGHRDRGPSRHRASPTTARTCASHASAGSGSPPHPLICREWRSHPSRADGWLFVLANVMSAGR